MNRLLYSVVVRQTAAVNGQALPSNPILLDVGYDRDISALQIPVGNPGAGSTHILKQLRSLGAAVSLGMSEVRKFQSLGLPCKSFVFGLIIDTGVAASDLYNPGEQPAPAFQTPPVTASYTLTPADELEKLFADVDTAPQSLLQRLHLSNRPQISTDLLTTDPNPNVDGIADLPIIP